MCVCVIFSVYSCGFDFIYIPIFILDDSVKPIPQIDQMSVARVECTINHPTLNFG